jgi:uncharacterized membrane protein
MATGKTAGSKAADPIVRAIAEARSGTACEIRVHVSRRLLERDPMARARRLFDRFGLARGRRQGAVLLYFNLRRHRFALLGDSSVDQALGPSNWQALARQLTEDLRSTDPERAIALAVASLGEKLRLHFPEDHH